ncbi:MAG: AMP-binding protein, partial [Bacteroidota bacterium]
MKEQTIVEQYEAAVKAFPANIAVQSGGQQLTYEALNNKANTLAQQIRETATSNSGNVTLLLDHNEEMITGILGALKAGKTYIPIDSHFPLDRCKFILNSSESSILVTTGSLLSLAYKLLNSVDREVTIINIADLSDEPSANSGLKVDIDQPAYVLYTSGSTGVPKGVAQSHRCIVNFMDSYIQQLDIKATDNVLLTTPYSHTVSAIDIFSTLFAGGTISVMDLKQDFDVRAIFNQLHDLNVSILHVVPTFFRYFMKHVSDKSLLDKIRLVILGGEEVLDKDVELYKEHYSDDCLFINLYGSSEVILATLNILNKGYQNDRKII